MALSSSDLLKVVFKRTIKAERGNISFDSDMLQLIAAIDQKKTVSQIANELDMNLLALRNLLGKLLQAGLIAPVKAEDYFIDADFMKELRYQLAVAVGPMADILIEDVVAEMSLTLGAIPVKRSVELLKYLAREIPEKDKSAAFLRLMMEWLQK